MELTSTQVLAALQDVKDPEIPVVSVVDLGIVQSVVVDGDRVIVSITPTFTGCPALELMRHEISERILALGATQVDVPVVLHPAWTSDRIAPAAREQMRRIGLMPPPPANRRVFAADSALSLDLMPMAGDSAAEAKADFDAGDESDVSAICPFCGASNTVLENAFGPTICRTLHYCHSCQQPFEAFKPL